VTVVVPRMIAQITDQPEENTSPLNFHRKPAKMLSLKSDFQVSQGFLITKEQNKEQADVCHIA
jgi:hypothetical protein